MVAHSFVLIFACVMCCIVADTTGIVPGETIFLKSRGGTGHHIDVEASVVQARYRDRGMWQALTIEKEGGGSVIAGDVVFLKTHTGAYIHVQDSVVRADWNHKGEWQRFLVQKPSHGTGAVLPGDTICLLAHTGHHLDAEDTAVRARFHDCGWWQQFVVQQEVENSLLAGATIFLKAHTGRHLDVQDSEVLSRWADHGTWQELSIETQAGLRVFSGDSVFLRSKHTGYHIDVRGLDVGAHLEDHGDWQTFTIEKIKAGPIFAGDFVFFRSHTGNHLDVQGDAGGVMRCRWNDQGTWQKFMIELSTSTTSWSSSTSSGFLAITTTTYMLEPEPEPEPEPETTTTSTMTATCSSSVSADIIGSMNAECQVLVTGSCSYKQRCLCYLQVPNATALATECALHLGDMQSFRETFVECSQDFDSDTREWSLTIPDRCCRHNKIILGSPFATHTAVECGALAVQDPDCDPNVVMFSSRRSWCYCLLVRERCQETTTCSGWNVWETETLLPLPSPPVPTISPTGYRIMRKTYCGNNCVDTIKQYAPYDKNETECEELCNAEPRCGVFDMAHCGRQCILLTHCSEERRVAWCPTRHPGSSVHYRLDYQPLVVTLGSPGFFAGGEGIWGSPASECGSNVYGDQGKGRCDPGFFPGHRGRVSICESKQNCIDSNITSALLCAEKAALISFCAKDFIEWRVSDSSCYCAPVGHTYNFSLTAGGPRIYPMTAEEPR